MRVKRQLLLSVVIVAVAAAVLLAMGRVPYCTCGYVKVWHGVVFSSENSQHLTDWYTFTHVIHGFGFYFLLWLVVRPLGLSLGSRFVLAVILESAWEVLENTPTVIDRYRETTIALDYYGDSVLNSVSDIAAMGLGFFMAARLPVLAIVGLAALMELALAYWIRDNLTLNILQLLFPTEAVLRWQQGGS